MQLRLRYYVRAYGIPPNLLEAIKLIYNNLRARTKTTEGDTDDYFRMFAGVMQEDTLAPYLFVIVLDYAMRKAISGRENELGLALCSTGKAFETLGNQSVTWTLRMTSFSPMTLRRQKATAECAERVQRCGIRVEC